MKKLLCCIVVLALVSLVSCSIAKIHTESISDELDLCYEVEFRSEFDRILTEMDEHIQRVPRFENFEGYLKDQVENSLVIEDYITSEWELGRHVNKTEFKRLCFDYSYSKKGQPATYEEYLAAPAPKNIAVVTTLSREKTFLGCLNQVKHKSAFVDDFLKLDMKTTSPNKFAKWVYDYRLKPGYDESIAQQIIALELYLMMLEILPMYVDFSKGEGF